MYSEDLNETQTGSLISESSRESWSIDSVILVLVVSLIALTPSILPSPSPSPPRTPQIYLIYVCGTLNLLPSVAGVPLVLLLTIMLASSLRASYKHDKLQWRFYGWVGKLFPPLEALPVNRECPIQAQCSSLQAAFTSVSLVDSMEFPLHSVSTLRPKFSPIPLVTSSTIVFYLLHLIPLFPIIIHRKSTC